MESWRTGLRANNVVGAVAIAGFASLLLLLPVFRPVAARPQAVGVTITPTAFVYLPYTARSDTQATPGPTPFPDVDLIVSDIYIYPEQPLTNHTFVITVSVTNQGSGEAATGTYVGLWIDDMKRNGNQAVPALGAHGVATVNWALSLGQAVTHTAKAEVDLTDMVSETNEINNTLTQSFLVVEP